ncbi:adenylate kinase [Streptomyces sp. NPDC005096]|uniref:adenylate kinase n=1 Tax=Streptomyces sp. NPDC005096 TaxID=3154559 RepID=UPI0033A21D15
MVWRAPSARSPAWWLVLRSKLRAPDQPAPNWTSPTPTSTTFCSPRTGRCRWKNSAGRQERSPAPTDGWIVEGNFSKLADVVWHRADTLVWLDFPLPLILYRIVRRSLRQLAGRDDSAQARSLTWSAAFFARRSLLRTAIRKYRTNRPRYARQVSETAAMGVEIVRLRSPRDVQLWKKETAKGPMESRLQEAARHTTGP